MTVWDRMQDGCSRKHCPWISSLVLLCARVLNRIFCSLHMYYNSVHRITLAVNNSVVLTVVIRLWSEEKNNLFVSFIIQNIFRIKLYMDCDYQYLLRWLIFILSKDLQISKLNMFKIIAINDHLNSVLSVNQNEITRTIVPATITLTQCLLWHPTKIYIYIYKYFWWTKLANK